MGMIKLEITEQSITSDIHASTGDILQAIMHLYDTLDETELDIPLVSAMISDSSTYPVTVLDSIVAWGAERGIDATKPDRIGYVTNIMEELFEGLGNPTPRYSAQHFVENVLPTYETNEVDEQSYIDHIADITVFSTTELTRYNYNPTLVLHEVHREINSRVGAWSDEEQKWVKDTSPEAQAKWHSANYENAKL